MEAFFHNSGGFEQAVDKVFPKKDRVYISSLHPIKRIKKNQFFHKEIFQFEICSKMDQNKEISKRPLYDLLIHFSFS